MVTTGFQEAHSVKQDLCEILGSFKGMSERVWGGVFWNMEH